MDISVWIKCFLFYCLLYQNSGWLETVFIVYIKFPIYTHEQVFV